jgi:3-methyladenine DNA glycosylase AlkC
VPEPFKNLIGPQTVRDAGAHLQRAWPAFDRQRFEQLAGHGLEALELKARAMHLCAALEATLPANFGAAADIIEASLGPPAPSDGAGAPGTTPAGLAGWVVWPLSAFIARRGLADPARALQALHALTQRFTAEWAVRNFIEHHPKLSFETLARWASDPSAHVRRLVSEGSRPRLPWGAQLKALITDPAPTLPLLAALQDDPSAYVRRSVANHLNDIAKDHPALVAQWIETHAEGASAQRLALLRHAARTLIKRGDPRVLAAFGAGQALRGDAGLAVTPRRLVLGGSLRLSVQLRSSSRRAQKLVIDYVVHHVKADGSTSPKVFKGWALTLGPGEARLLEKSHAVRPITTRRYHPGRHRVELQINGRTVAESSFELRVPVA